MMLSFRPIGLALTLVSAPALAVPGQPPQFSAGTGRYATAQSVVMTAGPGATIRYTTDGSTPEATSSLYTGAVAVPSSRPLRARAFYASLDPSPVTTASYFIGETTALPIMDLVLPPSYLFDPVTGIYVNYEESGDAWERPCHVALISPSGADVREADCGIRLHGGSSRDSAKKSFRLYFRSSYGLSSWNLAPYWTHSPDPTVDTLVLRGAANDCFLVPSSTQRDEATYLRDQLMRDWHAALGHRAGDGFYVALHINGQYWGLYNPNERINDNLCEDTFGGSEWDVVKGTWNSTIRYHTEVVDGDLAAFNELIAWADSHDLSVPANYAELQQRIDLDNFLEWFVLNIFGQNHDWPQNNFVAARRRDQAGARWRFFENDAEWAMGLRDTGWQRDSLAWALDPTFYKTHNPGTGSAPLSRLFANIVGGTIYVGQGGVNVPLVRAGNPEGRSRFVRLFQDALNFELAPETTRPQLAAAGALVQAEITREANRWWNQSPLNPDKPADQLISGWSSALGRMDLFLANRPGYVRGLIRDRFGLAGMQTLSISRSGGGTGRVSVNGHLVTPPWSGVFFAGQPIELAPVADLDSHFQSWTGAVSGTEPSQTFFAGSAGTATLTVTFGAGSTANSAGGVIFNEYWVNDDGTAYPSIGNRTIHGDWIELLVVDPAGVDMRGWRLTNNDTRDELSPLNIDNGSMIFPATAAFADIPYLTCILIVTSSNATNDAQFPADDLDPSDGQMIIYERNETLDRLTDPGFGVRTGDEALTLLAPGPTAIFADDAGVDFIAEGTRVTPASFGVPLTWTNPFSGIGGNDGAFFTGNASTNFHNDDGADPNTSDDQPGPGGWVVDPPAQFTGDSPGAIQTLTPGAINTGQAPGLSGYLLR